jgi:4,5-DOPA dioxygenase extradiol
MSETMPVLFVSHGSPMNAIQENAYTKALQKLGTTLPKPQVIVVFSAHWLSNGLTSVSTSEVPRQVYDFYGFPEELYQVVYRPTGAPAVADSLIRALSGIKAKGDANRGIDHGSWTVLKHLVPSASVPVIQISLDENAGPRGMLEVGRFLKPFRDQGILFIGSGNVTHNLGVMDMDQNAKRTLPWAAAFDEFVAKAVEKRDSDTLVAYRELMPREAAMAFPTDEHYLPILAVMGLAGEGDRLQTFYEGFQHASLSMRGFGFFAK